MDTFFHQSSQNMTTDCFLDFTTFQQKLFRSQRKNIGILSLICVQSNDQVKFIYFEKATNFCEISTLLLTIVHTVKSKVEILRNFVAFSEYTNFKTAYHSRRRTLHSSLKLNIKCCRSRIREKLDEKCIIDNDCLEKNSQK